MDGLIIEEELYLTSLRMSGVSFEFKIEGVDTFKIPIKNNRLDFQHYELVPIDFKRIIGNTTYYFGVSILDNKKVDGFIYVFGVSDETNKKLVVCRMRQLYSNHVEYLSDLGWLLHPKVLKPILVHVANELKVYHEDNCYKVFYSPNGISNEIYYAEATHLQKGFNKPQSVYKIDDLDQDLQMIAYNSKIQLIGEKKFVTYHVNTLKDENHKYAKIYYPRILEVEG